MTHDEIILRLLAKLDDLADPWVGRDRSGARVELRAWLEVHCFGEDHDLYDAIIAAIGYVPATNGSRLIRAQED